MVSHALTEACAIGRDVSESGSSLIYILLEKVSTSISG